MLYLSNFNKFSWLATHVNQYVTLIEAEANGWLGSPVWGFQWVRVVGFHGLGNLG